MAETFVSASIGGEGNDSPRKGARGTASLERRFCKVGVNVSKKIGKQTVRLSEGVVILSAASTVGPKEAEGPLGKYFDQKTEDMLFGESSWELAESKFVETNMKLAIEKANLKPKDLDYILCGDLLNQCTGSTFGIKKLEIPFFGLFGACPK